MPNTLLLLERGKIFHLYISAVFWNSIYIQKSGVFFFEQYVILYFPAIFYSLFQMQQRDTSAMMILQLWILKEKELLVDEI